MRFGVYVNTQAPPDGEQRQRVYREAIELAEVAEEAGLDAVFIPEHHQQPDAYLPSPFVMGGAIAARTQRIGINTGIMVLPLWHPLRVAEDVSVLDVISGGRSGLGVGLGLVEREYDQFGIDIRTAVGRFTEQIDILKRAFGEERFTFHGRHFNFDDVSLQPRPIQQPRPPIWLGGMKDASVQRAGRLGDGWITDPLHNIASMSAWADLYRAAARKAGNPEWIWLQRDVWVAETRKEVERDWAPHLVADWRFYFFALGLDKRFNPEHEPWIRDVTRPEDITFERLEADRVLAGTPDHVASELSRWAAAVRPDGVCFRLRFPHGPGHAETLRALRLFGQEVIPRFKATVAKLPAEVGPVAADHNR
jgi:alkanesulfonate monooxygenase SsuD/methylene tetrahydromethanopterin reductase-like flavin-dependent oxidoreductase (luciferase family)